jgi:transketolase
MRLASLMHQRVVFVMTHDSIGLGEDGPTHQPVEHLAALRAIPNHLVFRPADAMECAECWEIALNSRTAPATIALTRQNLPAVRTEYSEENLCARGAYELARASDDAAVTIFATGSEVEIALAARARLQAHGHPTRVVSVPCFELFEQQSKDYQTAIIGNSKVNIAIEAGIRQGWDRFIGRDGVFIGMHGFGASGPYEKLYEHFGITADAAAAAAEKLLHPTK